MPSPRRCPRVAWQATVAAPGELDDYVQMHLFEEGYLGYGRFNADEAVISIVLDSRRSQDPLEFARRRLPALPEQEWLRMNPISRPAARVGAGRIWLVGDAARVVEPFTGQGIYFALATGLRAAEAAEEGLRRRDVAAALGNYATRHRRLYRRSWVNTLVRWALMTPGRTVSLMRRWPPRPALISFLSDRVHATGLAA
jgi:2-polyprenyl-6-methoxyphenol hydroxylase-like FAD-dependent oxidoreductase